MTNFGDVGISIVFPKLTNKKKHLLNEIKTKTHNNIYRKNISSKGKKDNSIFKTQCLIFYSITNERETIC